MVKIDQTHHFSSATAAYPTFLSRRKGANRRRSILTSCLWMICAIVIGADHVTRAMAKRECSQCGGELVLAVRANQPQTNNDGPSLLTSAFTSWRCGTCGSAFTAAQLREDKRGRPKPTEHA